MTVLINCGPGITCDNHNIFTIATLCPSMFHHILSASFFSSPSDGLLHLLFIISNTLHHTSALSTSSYSQRASHSLRYTHAPPLLSIPPYSTTHHLLLHHTHFSLHLILSTLSFTNLLASPRSTFVLHPRPLLTTQHTTPHHCPLHHTATFHHTSAIVNHARASRRQVPIYEHTNRASQFMLSAPQFMAPVRLLAHAIPHRIAHSTQK